jgi:hypothetical protein
MQADLWQGLHSGHIGGMLRSLDRGRTDARHPRPAPATDEREMVTADTFVAELDAKNQISIQRVMSTLMAGIAPGPGGNPGSSREGFEVPDVLRLAIKVAMEAAEVAALWVTDCEDLEMKLSLAEQCGDGARQVRRLTARLDALGVAAYDAREGGYSKLFAFLRSLQTPEERSSAGYMTNKALSVARLAALGRFCEEKSDIVTARLLDDEILSQERRYYEEGRSTLPLRAPNEESQARARRAAYRTLELAGEMVEPLPLRKLMQKRR